MKKSLIVDRISDCIGQTPLLRIRSQKSPATLLLKLEMFNPNHHMKDRMARHMIDDAEKKGLLKPGGTIVESTSGNTGTGLAMIAAERGYQFIAIMDDHASKHKEISISAYGAKVLRIKSEDNGPATHLRVATAQKMAIDNPSIYWTEQHNNLANADAYGVLADELLAELPEIDVFISAIGTGGSLCGTSRRLKKTLPSLITIGVEPEGSIVFGGEGKPYYQSGTGTPAKIPVGDVVDYSTINEGLKVSDHQAFNTARYLAKAYGLLIGGSAGGVLYQAIKYLEACKKPLTIVSIIADSGEKYLDTIFNDDWMEEHNLLDYSIEQEIEEIIGRVNSIPINYNREAQYA